jgi:predicted nucleic acid-binding protein
MTEATRGLLDTSVVIDHDVIDPKLLPDESAISAITLAVLTAGPLATEDTEERARRQDRLQWASSTWDPLPFDADAARVYVGCLRLREPLDGRVALGLRTCLSLQQLPQIACLCIPETLPTSTR